MVKLFHDGVVDMILRSFPRGVVVAGPLDINPRSVPDRLGIEDFFYFVFDLVVND